MVNGMKMEIGYLAKLQECRPFQCCFQIRVVLLERTTSIIAYQVHQGLEFKWFSKSIAFIRSLKYGNPFELVGIPAVSVHTHGTQPHNAIG